MWGIINSWRQDISSCQHLGQFWDSGTQGKDLETITYFMWRDIKILSQKNHQQNANNKRPRDLGFGSGRKSGTIVNIWRKYEFGKN